MENRLEMLRNEIDKLVLAGNPENIRKYISHMYGTARFCTLLAMKRNLNAELATTCGMLHDIYYMSGGMDGDHARMGAVQAEAILKAMGLYRDDEITAVVSAVAKHSDKNMVHGPYDELLKDADVMDHCLYNTEFPVAQHEKERYRTLLKELGICADLE